MRKRIINVLTVISLSALTVIGFQNCGTDLGDPSTTTGLTVRLSSYDNGVAKWYHIIPKAHAAVGSLEICAHQLRLFRDGPGDGVNQVIDLGSKWIQVSPGGTLVANVDVVGGTYRRFELMLLQNCSGGLSLSLQNDNGSFTSDKPIILRFKGEIEIDSSTGESILGVQPFIDFLNGVDDANDIAIGVNNVEGDLN